MLKLDYSLSSSWNSSASVALADAEELVLRYDCFLGDVIFMVFEMDLSARWGWVPVLDFALALDKIVDALAAGDGAEDVFEFTESDAVIAFRRVGESVEVDASYVPGVGRVSYADLRAAAKLFVGRMLEDLVRERPELRRNSFIATKLGAIGAE